MTISKNWFDGYDRFLMHDGQEKLMKDIKVNDQLMSPDGEAITVTDILKSKKDIFYVSQVKGAAYMVSDESLLTLRVSMRPGYYFSEKPNSYFLCWLQEFKMMSKMFSVSTYRTKEKALTATKKYIIDVLNKDPKCSQYGDIVTIKMKDFRELPNKVSRLYKGFSSGIEFDDDIESDIYDRVESLEQQVRELRYIIERIKEV